MDASLEQRVSELEQRVGSLEGLLHRRGSGARAGGSLPTRTPDTGPILNGDERTQLERAETLLTELLALQPPQLISYSEAYRRIIGPYSVWRNAVHAPEIIRIASRTSTRQVGALSVRLDALMVGKQTRRPAGGHFTSVSYGESDWIRIFGTWPLLG
jgi:hypothetical protein